MSYLYRAHTQDKSKAAASETLAHPDSSFLQASAYDAQMFSLTLDFKNGTQVIHKFVYPMVWQQFKESPSKGSFYSRFIKNKYPSVSFRSQPKVSDLKRAIKESRHAAN